MNDPLKKLALNFKEHIEGLCAIPCSLLDLEERSFGTNAFPHFCLSDCPMYQNERCNCITPHLYGCFESERWSGKYIYYCPIGLIFAANSLTDAQHLPCGGFISGPIVMGDLADFLDVVSPAGMISAETVSSLPNLSTARVNHLCEVIGTVCRSLSKSAEEPTLDSKKQASMLSMMYDQTQKRIDNAEEYRYLLDCERKLKSLISSGDKSGSQALLNTMLGHIYFSSAGNIQTTRARIIELIVVISRAAIDGGADINQIFWLNTGYIREAERFQNMDDLSRWLSTVMHRFINCVFDFGDIKHVDVMYKVLEYVKDHYSEKIGLDDVATHVYLSKSYLSKIFKEEIGCTFTVYANKLRVEKCKEYLLETNLSLVEIASLVGFEDQSYFTKVFKKIVGSSPGKFRETRGKLNN